jgi:hypothetical protein
MRAKLRALVLTALVVLPMVGGWAGAQEAKNVPTPEVLLKALVENGKPGAEHQQLQPFVGDWTFTLKVWTDPSQPPAELKGSIERKWIMDGRFVQETLHGECCKTGKTFEGLGLLGYDRAQKTFTATKACGLCGTVSSGAVRFDASAGRLECTKDECCPLTGQKVKIRNEIILESSNRIVANTYRAADGKEVRIMEMISTRK